MRITIVIDDADGAAATEAAQTISQAFVRTGGSGSVSSVESARPVPGFTLGADADAGAAPRFGVGGPSSPGTPSDSGDDRSAPATPSRPSLPNPPPRQVDPIDESAGAAPELGGGG